MIRHLAALAGAMALGVGIAVSGVNFALEQAHADTPIRTEWMACSNDEPPATGSCVWDALHQGNGLGQSFYIGRESRLWAIPHHIAHYLLNGNNARGSYYACTTPVEADPTDCIWDETVWLGYSGNETAIPRSVGQYLLSR